MSEQTAETRVYNIVGVTFENRQEVLQDFYDNHYKVGGSYPIQLVLEDNNPYDSNAIAVHLFFNGKAQNVGYISKNENQELRKLINKIDMIELRSMGPNYKGILGLSIVVTLME